MTNCDNKEVNDYMRQMKMNGDNMDMDARYGHGCTTVSVSSIFDVDASAVK